MTSHLIKQFRLGVLFNIKIIFITPCSVIAGKIAAKKFNAVLALQRTIMRPFAVSKSITLCIITLPVVQHLLYQ